MSRLLAEEFVSSGHEVRLVTQTPSEGRDDLPFPVFRHPAVAKLFELVRWCDIFWQNNLSLRTFWPARLSQRPIVITHQGSYCRKPAGLDLVQRLKHSVVEQTTSVAISEAVARCFNVHSLVIPNPFAVGLFTAGPPTQSRPNELIFVGRLVTEKGLDLLLEAMAKLRKREVRPRLTIVGAGPELTPMEELTARLGLTEQVTFAGPKRGADLAATLQEHRILVVPSRYDEPFGVVALEGIASGCVALGSSGGGLPEAIGPCGLTFPNGDADALAEKIERLLSSPNECEQLRAGAPQHLARFQPGVVAAQYLALFQSKLR